MATPTVDIYFMPESPPCRSVEMVANMIGVKLNKHYINLFTKDHLKDEYVKLNPRHKIPFMVDGDLKINESRAMMTYLVNRYSPQDKSLYPEDPVERAKVDELLYYDIGTLFPSAGKLLRHRLFGDVNANLDAEDEKVFKENLQYLDKRLADNGGRKFMLGDTLTLADIALTTSLNFSIACGYELKEFKNLVKFLECAKTNIPDYSKINDEPIANTMKFIESRRKAGAQ